MTRGLFPAGITLMMASVPLILAVSAWYEALWYAGSALVLAWLIADDRRLE